LKEHPSPEIACIYLLVCDVAEMIVYQQTYWNKVSTFGPKFLLRKRHNKRHQTWALIFPLLPVCTFFKK